MLPWRGAVGKEAKAKGSVSGSACEVASEVAPAEVRGSRRKGLQDDKGEFFTWCQYYILLTGLLVRITSLKGSFPTLQNIENRMQI